MTSFEVQLDHRPDTGQHEEALEVTLGDGTVQSMRLHEYDRVYAIPGLYEEVVQNRLQCASPARLAEELVQAVHARGEDPAALRALDIGAGNGLVGEALRARGVVEPFLGLDTEPAAKDAVERDRPGLYRDYFACGLDDVDVGGLVADLGVNAIVGAGALGLGHIPPASFERAWSALPSGGWFAVTASETVASSEDRELSGYIDSLRRGERGTEVVAFERFQHRLRMSGEPIHYYVIVGRRT